MLNLATLRKHAGLKQKDIAEKMGVDRSTVTKWETSKAAPRASELPKLAKILNCTITELFQ